MNLIPAANLEIKDKFETTFLGNKFSHPIGLLSGVDILGNASMSLNNLGFELIQIGPLSNQTDKIIQYPVMNFRKNSLFIKNIEPTSSIEESFNHIQNTIEKIIQKNQKRNIVFATDLKVSTESLKTVPYMSDTFFLNIVKTSTYLSDFATINLSCYENKSILQYRNLEKFQEFLTKIKNEIYYEAAYKYILEYEKNNGLENNITDKMGLNSPVKFFKKSRTKFLIKLDTDLEKNELKDIYNIIKESKIIDGIIVGGFLNKRGFFISGQEAKKVSIDQLKNLYEISKGEIPLISSGGISTGEDVYERLKLGAKMVLIYYPFIINGPYCLEKILKELDAIMTRENKNKIKEIPIIQTIPAIPVIPVQEFH